MLAVFGSFVLFYSDPAENVYLNAVFDRAIQRYHLNSNLADAVDYIQETVGPRALL